MRVADTDAMVSTVVSMLRKVIYIEDGSITAETKMQDLGLDSLDLMEAGLELEAAVGCEMPDGIIFDIVTVGDLASCLIQQPRQVLARAA